MALQERTKGVRWHRGVRHHGTNAAVGRFLAAVEVVCREHGYSISHEDHHGAFIIEPFDEGTLEWLRWAAVGEGIPPDKLCGPYDSP
jgi:hypothetical protein